LNDTLLFQDTASQVVQDANGKEAARDTISRLVSRKMQQEIQSHHTPSFGKKDEI